MSEKRLSKKKQKQLTRKKYLSKPKSKPKSNKEYNLLYKNLLVLALFNISKIIAENGDNTWGGIVDPETYEVVEKYWPNTNIEISEIDKSRINAISYTMITGDTTWDYNYMKSLIKGGKKGKKKHLSKKKKLSYKNHN